MSEPWPCAQAHLEDVLPPILNGLADESEGVRQAALAAGRTLVDLYALSALELLLPAVERGCAHENWRIRQSSVELLGDLLFKVPVMSCGSPVAHPSLSYPLSSSVNVVRICHDEGREQADRLHRVRHMLNIAPQGSGLR